jgi:hypothetical protein
VKNRFTNFWTDRSVAQQCTTAVSLHGHTNHSRETLFFIRDFAEQQPWFRWIVKLANTDAQKKSAIRIDFKRSYWTPPLPPLEAFTVERRQIEEGLGMRSMISLTDHDTIEAPLLLRVVPEARRIPVSLEWSVPFQATVFHLGVHNLPSADAQPWMDRLAALTAYPDPREMRDILAALAAIPQVLLVFNHPLWDLPGVGKAIHRNSVRDLLSVAQPFLHAFELGGLREWKENAEVIELARAYQKPYIAGGDRHGCEPSALLNLTNAASFSEFVAEVRQGHSHVLAMPQYAESNWVRVYHTVLDVIRYYPGHPFGTRSWDNRVFHPNSEGEIRPVATLWDGPPLLINWVFNILRLGEAQPMRRALFALSRGRQVAELGMDGQEAS